MVIQYIIKQKNHWNISYLNCIDRLYVSKLRSQPFTKPMAYHIKKQSVLLDSKTVYYKGDSKWTDTYADRKSYSTKSSLQMLRLRILMVKMVLLQDALLSQNK